MRSKAPLALMEQLVMVLVFAIAGALCLRMFAASDTLSVRYAAVDRAVLEVQTAAEQLKQGSLIPGLEEQGAACGNGVWTLGFDENWNTVPAEEAVYYMQVTYENSDNAYLWRARISAFTSDDRLLFELPVSGQKSGEVTGNE